MDKIEIRIVLYPLEDRHFFLEQDLIPPHVGYLQAGIALKRHHSSGNDSQSVVPTELLGFLEQELQSQAYA